MQLGLAQLSRLELLEGQLQQNSLSGGLQFSGNSYTGGAGANTVQNGPDEILFNDDAWYYIELSLNIESPSDLNQGSVINSTVNTIMVALTDNSTGNPSALELATFKTVSNYPPIGAFQTGITAACTVYMTANTSRYVRVYSYLPALTQTSSTGLSVLQITKLN